MAEIPEMIGKYRIEGLVAKGGMGAVYKAVHPTLKRYVIIKKLTIKGNSAITERFKREARIMLDFKHEHIVHVHDHFKEGSSHYIVLEFVDGMSLDQLIRKRRFLSSPMALVIFLDACKALAYAHDKGVIHRDIKPGNILMSRKGEVKLADFGIASSEEEDESGLTKEGMTLGTPSYMPPEQFENTRNVDKRADVYAMGIMLYEMLTGKKPFPGNFAPDTILMIQKGRYVQARRINPEIPKRVNKLIRRLIKPDPRKRFQDMGAVIRIVGKLLARYPVDAIRASLAEYMNGKTTDEPAWKPRGRKRFVLVPLSVLVAAAGAGGYYGWTNGYAYRWILPGDYGALAVTVRVPKAQKDSSEIFLKARLFVNDNKDFPELADAPVDFSQVPTEAADPYYSFVSAPVYAKPGAYRLKLLSEGRVYWESLRIAPFSEAPAGASGDTVVQLRLDDLPPGKLSLTHESRNAITGADLGAATRFYVSLNGDWKLVDDLSEGSLLSGRLLKFRAVADGYYSETFSLLLRVGQEDLRLAARLVPLVGKLKFELPEGSWRLTLDGRDSYVSGGREMAMSSLAGIAPGPVEIALPAGRYEFAAASGQGKGAINVTIYPNRNTRLKLTPGNGVVAMKTED